MGITATIPDRELVLINAGKRLADFHKILQLMSNHSRKASIGEAKLQTYNSSRKTGHAKSEVSEY